MLDFKHFVLGYYKNASDGIHIHKVHNSTEAKHTHTHEYFQMYYIIKGSLVHYIDNTEARLTVGDMILVPPGVAHKISEDKDTEFYSLSFMPDIIEALAPASFCAGFINSFLTEKFLIPKVTLPAEDILTVEKTIEQMHKEFDSKKIGSSEIVRAYTLILISVFARHYHPKAPGTIINEDSSEFILYCIKYIESNFSQNITLKEIVELSAMSKTKFCKMFAEVAGCSFTAYLNRCRIAKAADYIKKGYKITAIYGLCGYNDFSTFNRNFNKALGMSPLEYKRTISKDNSPLKQ